MKRNNLHEIDRRIQTITDDRIDPETGEVFDEENAEQTSAALLSELQMEREEKIIHCGLYMQEHQLEVERITSVIVKLRKRLEQHKNSAAFLKRWVEDVAYEDEVFETPEIKLMFRKSLRYEIRTEADIPKDLWRTKITRTLDKVLAKKWAKKHGDTPPGVDEIPVINLQVK